MIYACWGHSCQAGTGFLHQSRKGWIVSDSCFRTSPQKFLLAISNKLLAREKPGAWGRRAGLAQASTCLSRLISPALSPLQQWNCSSVQSHASAAANRHPQAPERHIEKNSTVIYATSSYLLLSPPGCKLVIALVSDYISIILILFIFPQRNQQIVRTTWTHRFIFQASWTIGNWGEVIYHFTMKIIWLTNQISSKRNLKQQANRQWQSKAMRGFGGESNFVSAHCFLHCIL